MFRLRRKGKGPLEGNRLVDTPEVKVDQLFTRKDEKLVAICVTMSRDAAMKIGAEGVRWHHQDRGKRRILERQGMGYTHPMDSR